MKKSTKWALFALAILVLLSLACGGVTEGSKLWESAAEGVNDNSCIVTDTSQTTRGESLTFGQITYTWYDTPGCSGYLIKPH